MLLRPAYKGLRPLHRSAAISLTLQRYSLPDGHVKYGAAPAGAFDWTQGGLSGAWGRGSPVATSECLRHSEAPTEPTGETPNKLHWNIENDIPMPFLPTIRAGWHLHEYKPPVPIR